jgi:YbgC/YbaW family acyl-CoA thioester hydrolase
MPPQPFVIEEYVRWSDVDLAGIIFYGSYVRFFELAETELFRAAGLAYSTLFDAYDMYLPRVQVHAEFLYPPRLDDRLSVAAYFGRIGTKSLTINFDVILHSSERHCAYGHMVLVCTDRIALRSRPLPAELVERLRPFALAVADARRQLGIPA